MPNGKPAGVRCIHLSPGNLCMIYRHPDRPEVCNRLRPSEEMCGDSTEYAMLWLTKLELLTQPGEPKKFPHRPL